MICGNIQFPGLVFDMVGDGYCIESVPPRFPDTGCRPYKAVGKDGMHVEVAFQGHITGQFRDIQDAPLGRQCHCAQKEDT